ncbi:PTS system, lactose/cellobiose family IIC component [Enterococcus faecium PC4.1]|nr:PTS system, lactose/cellobiose family IIC component [Enterococcus faecium PC4.1]
MEALEKFLNKFIGPIAQKMNGSKFFSALAEAFMRTTPITLGVALLMIIGNFPIPQWIEFLSKTGMTVHFNAALGATINLLSVYVTFNFAFIYSKKDGYDPLPAGLLAVGSFFILMPQVVQTYTLEQAVTEFPAHAVVTASNNVEAFASQYTGGTGLFVAIIVGYFTAVLYGFLIRKNLTIKMPDTVPSNVSESLSPAILSGVCFGSVFYYKNSVFLYPIWQYFCICHNLNPSTTTIVNGFSDCNNTHVYFSQYAMVFRYSSKHGLWRSNASHDG